ncbi:hypothetical protein CERSUDRAFT_147199 [Gelatoporia subvermispora B]|uniref:Spindle pole body component n=1 Tax=Ceriporiopsis subvermispora (strain B) TaxID=914234 RepID=M2QXJ4_CERS8|nr:hypothetical protein CERSUDRAFT_147199 [Gelatoporia subvermispora B]
MIAEVLLVLAGHESSLFLSQNTINPAFSQLLHPGEEQCLQVLGQIALRYRKIKTTCSSLSRSPSRYVCALCATLNKILQDEYETLVVSTEARVLKRDPDLVASGSFVPLSSLRAVFSEWDAPLAALESLVEQLQAEQEWRAGPLIDLLLARLRTGIHRVASIFSRLSDAVQRVWMSQLQALLNHGTLSTQDSLATSDYKLVNTSIPSCISAQSRDSITYVGRAIGTVKAAKWGRQFPREIALDHSKLLETVLPSDQYAFDRVISDIRTTVSEWLWLNVLTHKDVEVAVESLADYFLLRNGEFALSLIREVERLKLSRLTGRAGTQNMIREQDLQLALLRASLGTTAQHDPSLSQLRFHLPSGPLRPLLPSLAYAITKDPSESLSTSEPVSFDDLLLGTKLVLDYNVSWPLDLFLHPSDLQIYGALFAYLSALRKTHTRVHTCWTSLSSKQRERRVYTGIGEGGTAEDLTVRQGLLRSGWGVVREMDWFLETLLGYVMMDVVDVEFRRLKELLFGKIPRGRMSISAHPSVSGAEGTVQDADIQMLSSLPTSNSATSNASSRSSHLDFTSLRSIHTTYLERLLTGTLLSNPALIAHIRAIFEVCEHFVAQVERWGGDILPSLLGEGSLAAGDDRVGSLVEERWTTVATINESLRDLLRSFYEQLSLSTTQQPFSAAVDASKSMLYSASVGNVTGFQTFIRPRRGKGSEGDAEVRRHIERLLLRLDFNGEFSKLVSGEHDHRPSAREGILKQGGLA